MPTAHRLAGLKNYSIQLADFHFHLVMWRVCKALRPTVGFHVDEPPNHSRYTVELFVTVEEVGRTDSFEAEFSIYRSCREVTQPPPHPAVASRHRPSQGATLWFVEGHHSPGLK